MLEPSQTSFLSSGEDSWSNSSTTAPSEFESFPSTWEKVLEVGTLSTICVSAVVSNVSLWIVVLTTRSLRNESNYLILCLSLADLLVSTVSMPITVATIITSGWTLSRTTCTAMGYINMLAFVASVESLGVISVNRYVKICRPSMFVDVYTTKSVLLMSAGVWLVSGIMSLPPLFGWARYSYLPLASICFCNWSLSWSYAFFMIACCFCVPCTIMMVCYVSILRAFQRSSKTLQSFSQPQKPAASLSAPAAQRDDRQGGGHQDEGGGQQKPMDISFGKAQTDTPVSVKIADDNGLGNGENNLRNQRSAPVKINETAERYFREDLSLSKHYRDDSHNGCHRSEDEGDENDRCENVEHMKSRSDEATVCGQSEIVGEESKHGNCRREHGSTVTFVTAADLTLPQGSDCLLTSDSTKPLSKLDPHTDQSGIQIDKQISLFSNRSIVESRETSEAENTFVSRASDESRGNPQGLKADKANKDTSGEENTNEQMREKMPRVTPSKQISLEESADEDIISNHCVNNNFTCAKTLHISGNSHNCKVGATAARDVSPNSPSKTSIILSDADLDNFNNENAINQLKTKGSSTCCLCYLSTDKSSRMNSYSNGHALTQGINHDLKSSYDSNILCKCSKTANCTTNSGRNNEYIFHDNFPRSHSHSNKTNRKYERKSQTRVVGKLLNVSIVNRNNLNILNTKIASINKRKAIKKFLNPAFHSDLTTIKEDVVSSFTPSLGREDMCVEDKLCFLKKNSKPFSTLSISNNNNRQRVCTSVTENGYSRSPEYKGAIPASMRNVLHFLINAEPTKSSQLSCTEEQRSTSIEQNYLPIDEVAQKSPSTSHCNAQRENAGWSHCYSRDNDGGKATSADANSFVPCTNLPIPPRNKESNSQPLKKHNGLTTHTKTACPNGSRRAKVVSFSKFFQQSKRNRVSMLPHAKSRHADMDAHSTAAFVQRTGMTGATLTNQTQASAQHSKDAPLVNVKPATDFETFDFRQVNSSRSEDITRLARSEARQDTVSSDRHILSQIDTSTECSETAKKAPFLNTNSFKPSTFHSRPESHLAPPSRNPATQEETPSTSSSLSLPSSQKPTSSSARGSTLDRRRREEFRLSASLLVVIVLFIVCWFPYCISMFLFIYRPDISGRSLDMTALLLGYLNSSVNPIVYGLMNRRFKDGYRTLFKKYAPSCCFRRGRRKVFNVVSTITVKD
ncbi:rhodopsin, gq-coupled [Plakobranchus ocellatus]|uniref:Rhodopsin, gq-coupled n=1 Tax=Plakobranchus ocellatus TaxID=259542 RepID=A0AAV3Y414_9GAST|nr:rhodopsin, gq-coupled [Plakobranchus ocellatus]